MFLGSYRIYSTGRVSTVTVLPLSPPFPGVWDGNGVGEGTGDVSPLPLIVIVIPPECGVGEGLGVGFGIIVGSGVGLGVGVAIGVGVGIITSRNLRGNAVTIRSGKLNIFPSRIRSTGTLV